MPNPEEIQQPTLIQQLTLTTAKKTAKKTCRESRRGKTVKKSETKPKPEKRSRTLSESRQVTFGIALPPVVSRSVCSNRKNIDYLTLNDGLEDNEVPSPKRRHKATYRPCSGPSSTRQATRKHSASPESQNVKDTGTHSTLPAVPSAVSKSTPSDELTGVPNETDDQILPDLVLEHDEPDTTQAVSTEEEMDAVTALLSLGEVGNETLDDNNENAELMPIGGQNVPLDIAPQPIRLDQLSVDNAITEMTQVNDQLEDTAANMKTEEQAEVQTIAKPGDATKDNTSGTKNTLSAAPPPASENNQELSTKGTL